MAFERVFKPLPYYRFYWQAWRANRRVQRLSLVQRGAYRELLDECWAEGSIPDDPAKLAEIIGCSTGEMREMWPTLRDLFAEAIGNPGHLTNARLEQERTETDAVRVERVNAGRKGGFATLGKKDDGQGDLLTITPPSKANAIEHRRGELKGEKRRVKRREEESGNPETDLAQSARDLVDLWNTGAIKHGYAKVTAVKGHRRTHLLARMQEDGWLDRAKRSLAYLTTDSWYQENPDAIRFDVLLKPGKAEYYCERAGVPRSSSSKAASRNGARAGVDAAIHEDLKGHAGKLEASDE